MSVYTKCVECGADLSLEELLKSLFRVDSEGNTGLEVKLNICSETSTPAVPCDGSERSLEQLIKASLVLDDCGNCSLKLFVDAALLLDYICDYCNQR